MQRDILFSIIWAVGLLLVGFNVQAAEKFDLMQVNGLHINVTKEQLNSIYEQIAVDIVKDYDLNCLYEWVDGNASRGLMLATAIAVHEETHVYAHPEEVPQRNIQGLCIEFDEKQESILRIRANGEIYNINTFNPFNSKIVKEYIPKKYSDLQMINYLEKPTYNSNVLGVFGLLDEYNAYNKEVQYLVNLEKIVKRNNINIYRYKNVLSEFKYMILTYLIYAEENKPEQFDKFMENIELRSAYSAVDEEVKKSLEELEILAQGNEYALQEPEINKLLKTEKFIEMDKKFKIIKNDKELF